MQLIWLTGDFVMSTKEIKALERRFWEEWNKGKAAFRTSKLHSSNLIEIHNIKELTQLTET